MLGLLQLYYGVSACRTEPGGPMPKKPKSLM
jgi:hypothetical protein